MNFEVPQAPYDSNRASSMFIKEYIALVIKLFKKDDMLLTAKEHSNWGIISEHGELIDAYKKSMVYSQALDIDNVTEEIGDLIFYLVTNLLPPSNKSNESVVDLFNNFINVKYTVEQSRTNVITELNSLNRILSLLLTSSVEIERMNLTAKVLTSLSMIGHLEGISIRRCIKHNIRKRIKRYPAGEYTDGYAGLRLDKGGE
jgi:hypothetical protein